MVSEGPVRLDYIHLENLYLRPSVHTTLYMVVYKVTCIEHNHRIQVPGMTAWDLGGHL